MSNAVAEKPLNELLSRSMVDIYVGPENTHWILHEKLLCHHSPYFRKIFYSKASKYSKTQSFGLPDEEDVPFKSFIGWLYSSALPVPREESDLGVYFDLYLMAEKFEIPALVSDVLQVVREWYKYSDTYPSLRRIQYVYANTEDGSPMRHMLVHSVARLMVLEKGIPSHWDKALRKNGQLAVDIIRAIQDWRLEDELVPDAREDPEQAEELIDVEQETEKLDQQAEAEIDGNEADVEEVADEESEVEADESEATIVDSSTSDLKRRDSLLKPNSPKLDKENDSLEKDFKKFSLKEVPIGLAGGDYGTLRA